MFFNDQINICLLLYYNILWLFAATKFFQTCMVFLLIFQYSLINYFYGFYLFIFFIYIIIKSNILILAISIHITIIQNI